MDEKKENISLLQSRGWSEFQRNVLKKDVFEISTDLLRGIVFKSPIGMEQYYAYAPYGPAGKYDIHSIESFVDEVRSKKELARAFFLRIEPFQEFSEEVSSALISSGFKKVPCVQPEETELIDLRMEEKKLLSNMEHNTRYAIRAAERRGVKIRSYEGKDVSAEAFSEFWELFSETNERHALRAYGKEYYKGLFSLGGDCRAKLYFADVENRAIAAAIIVFFNNRATYLYAASRRGFGRYNAPTYLLWSAMRDAKHSGFSVFDLWGVSSTNAKWAGVTAFKKSFGGSLVRYQGTWDYIFNGPKYLAYQILKRSYIFR